MEQESRSYPIYDAAIKVLNNAFDGPTPKTDTETVDKVINNIQMFLDQILAELEEIETDSEQTKEQKKQKREFLIQQVSILLQAVQDKEEKDQDDNIQQPSLNLQDSPDGIEITILDNDLSSFVVEGTFDDVELKDTLHPLINNIRKVALIKKENISKKGEGVIGNQEAIDFVEALTFTFEDDDYQDFNDRISLLQITLLAVFNEKQLPNIAALKSLLAKELHISEEELKQLLIKVTRVFTQLQPDQLSTKVQPVFTKQELQQIKTLITLFQSAQNPGFNLPYQFADLYVAGTKQTGIAQSNNQKEELFAERPAQDMANLKAILDAMNSLTQVAKTPTLSQKLDLIFKSPTS